MFNSVALDVVIGLVFVYLLYSLLGTLIQEIIATNIGLRGWMLEKAIKRMLDDGAQTPSSLSTAFYAHPLIKYMADGSWPLKNKPSYIDRETFSKIVIDLLRGQKFLPGDSARQPIQNSFNNGTTTWLPAVPIENETLTYLRSIWADSQGDVVKFKNNLEQWFDEMMQRTTGWYKKYTQLILLLVGLVVAIAFNVDTIKLIETLKNNPSLREQVLNQANAFVKQHPNLDAQIAQTQAKIISLNNLPKTGTSATAGVNSTKPDSLAKVYALSKDSLTKMLAADSASRVLRDTLFKQATSLVGTNIKQVNDVMGIGWSGGLCKNFTEFSILGWLLTALAISMGAPFWFDLLNKLMQLKSAVAPNDSSNSKSGTTPKTVNTVG